MGLLEDLRDVWNEVHNLIEPQEFEFRLLAYLHPVEVLLEPFQLSPHAEIEADIYAETLQFFAQQGEVFREINQFEGVVFYQLQTNF
jgi:hypothetical protein